MKPSKRTRPAGRSTKAKAKSRDRAGEGPARFTLADLVALLRSVPKPDPAYWDTLERITRDQPALQPSPWAR